MVKNCYKCGTRSFGRCSNECPKILRFQSPKDEDFRFICFKCFQQVAKKENEQIQQHNLRLNKRLKQLQEQLDAAALQLLACLAKEAKDPAVPEEPEETQPAKKRLRSSLHPEPQSLKRF